MFGFLARSVITGVVVYVVGEALKESTVLQNGLRLGVDAVNAGLTKLGDYITTQQMAAAAAETKPAAPPKPPYGGAAFAYDPYGDGR